MTFFFIFSLLAFGLSVGAWHLERRRRQLVMFGLTLYICFGYYFLDKI